MLQRFSLTKKPISSAKDASLLTKRRWFRRILRICAMICAFNSASYAGALLFWHFAGENGADLEMIQQPGADGTMVYLVAGSASQPRSTFDFLLPDLGDYGVTLVSYRANRGCDRGLMARQVVADAQKNNYRQVLVIGCSMGDYVGRYCEEQIGAYSIAICPMPDPALLKPWAKLATRGGTPAGRLVTLALGWISQTKWQNACGDSFSLSFMVSQFGDIGYRADAPRCSSKLLGIIVAEADETGQGEDEFLNGREAMSAYYGDTVPIYSVKGAGHANTSGEATAFRAAWSELWTEARVRLEN